MIYLYIQPANRQPSKHTIQVNGEGKIPVHPDQAVITLGAATTNQPLSTAQKENTAIIANVKKALNGYGVADEQIQTADYSIYPQYDFVDGKQVFRGYKVDHMLAITVKNIEIAGLIVDTAVNHGANAVTGITFSVVDYEKQKQQALSAAVADAQQKAETIARAVGGRLAKIPFSITERKNDHNGPIPYEMNSHVKSAFVTPLQPGILEIKSCVTAQYYYIGI